MDKDEDSSEEDDEKGNEEQNKIRETETLHHGVSVLESKSVINLEPLSEKSVPGAETADVHDSHDESSLEIENDEAFKIVVDENSQVEENSH